MKRIFLIIPAIIIFILVAGLLALQSIIKPDKEEPRIGVDEYNCRILPGYSWDEELEECIQLEKVINKTYCESPRPEICTMDYAPVCGFYSKEIQCIKAPCGGTYSNGCSACSDEKVEFYTEGECDE